MSRGRVHERSERFGVAGSSRFESATRARSPNRTGQAREICVAIEVVSCRWARAGRAPPVETSG